jgi:hypothetical protein
MEAAKARIREIRRCQIPYTEAYFAVILRQVTGQREEKNAAGSLVEDGSLLSGGI